VTVRTSNPDQRPQILETEIRDSGIGIEKEMLGSVFDAFVQEEHSGAHRFGGIGLGLSITKKLVELQGGQISAESQGRNRGATFRIFLPVAATKSAAVDSAPPKNHSAPQISRRILLVEDHEDTRRTMVRLLQKHGHVVTEVSSAGAAREAAAGQPFDLVLSDLGLPDGDGHTLMASLHDKYGLRGIALSGYGMEDDIARSRASGFYRHLTKPVSLRELENAIADFPG